jgi:hypothetical protein
MVAKVKVSRPVTVKVKDVASPQAVDRIWRDAAKVVRSEASTVRQRRVRAARRITTA